MSTPAQNMGVAIYERQRELNEIRDALGLSPYISHEALIEVLRAMADVIVQARLLIARADATASESDVSTPDDRD